jgi:hypothetical protein
MVEEMIPLLLYTSEYSMTALQDSIAFVGSNTFLSLPTKMYDDEQDISLIRDNSVTTQNLCFFQEKLLTVFKCHNFLGVQQ